MVIIRKIIFCAVILCFLIFISGGVYAASLIDSLEIALKSAKGVQRAEILNSLSYEYATVDIEKSEKLNVEALELSVKLKDQKQEAISYYNYGFIFQSKGEIDKSLEYYIKSLSLRKEIDDKLGIGSSLNGIGIIYKKMGDYEKALKSFQESLTIRLEISDKDGISKSYNNIGGVYNSLGDFTNAILNYKKAAVIKEEIGDLKGKAISLNNVGNCYMQQGEYTEAAKSQQEALDIFEKIEFKPGIASCLINLGLINEKLVEYFTDGKEKASGISDGDTIRYSKTLAYYRRAIGLSSEIGDKYSMALALDNIGTVYSRTAIYSEARVYFNKCIEVRTEIGDKQGLASAYNNIGTSYLLDNECAQARAYFETAYKMSEEINFTYGKALYMFAIGRTYNCLGDFKKALESYNKSITTAKEAHLEDILKQNYEAFSFVYDSLGDYKNSLKYYKMWVVTKDSMVSADFQKIFTEAQEKYESDKKQKEIELLNKDKTLQDNQIAQQRILIFVFIIVSIVVIIFLVLVFRLFKQKKKANVELEHKNELITEQKKEIMDSIHYAKRIQTAILPPEDQVSSHLPEHFVLFKPKDIVSGDFHWSTTHNGKLVMVAADCTGHGVPGAFMSMLGVSFLNEIVNEKGISNSNEIVDQLRENIIKSLQQTGKSGEAKDGMDLSLCVLDLETYHCQFTGANNPLYLINNGELTEYKGDKMPVAIYERMDPFTRNEFQLNSGDCIYLFSDGFADQFGGPKGKKFMYKPFKNLIINMQEASMAAQKTALNDAIESWKANTDPLTGNNYEQVDDICVIGLRIK